MNTELGGLFSSRINMNLREAHGYTYGAGSTFAYHRQPGPFLAYSAVRTDVTAPATSEIFNELRRMRSEEHTSELQSPDHLVCRLLLEKKKRKIKTYKV